MTIDYIQKLITWYFPLTGLFERPNGKWNRFVFDDVPASTQCVNIEMETSTTIQLSKKLNHRWINFRWQLETGHLVAFHLLCVNCFRTHNRFGQIQIRFHSRCGEWLQQFVVEKYRGHCLRRGYLMPTNWSGGEMILFLRFSMSTAIS